jgi:MFS family permease
MLQRARATYNEFPKTFWTLMGASFIDRLGGALLFPFFALYVTQHFGVGMTQVGILFAIFSISGILGSFLGGAMTDKFGRKSMLLFGLVVSALSSLLMAFVSELYVFYSLAAFVGLLSNTGGPAQQAMIADLLPPEKLTEGYGLWRVIANLAVAVGPAIGGFVIAIYDSYIQLFVIDAVSSVITAVIVFYVIPETKPALAEDKEEESLVQTFGGYSRVLRDSIFMSFIAISIVVIIVYVQMNSTMPVYLRDVQGIPPLGYGYILSLNAGMVVFMQFWITRRLTGRAPLRLMALGSLLYTIGFAMYGVNSTIYYYAFAMVIITIGEMIVVPVSQAVAARFAPEDMRGRYMAMFGFSYAIPFGIGPLLAGLIMDAFDPRWVWWASGILGTIGVIGYLLLDNRVGQKLGNMDAAGETT